MAERYSEEWKAGLLDPERKLHGLGVVEFLEAAGLRPGMTMVDYGCGPGFVTLPAAEIVGPAGRVYGLDVHEGMVELARSRAAEAGLANVTTLLNDGPRAPLQDCIADLVTCILGAPLQRVAAREAGRRVRHRADAQAGRLRCGHPVGRPGAIRGDGRPAYAEAGLECSGQHSVVDKRYRVSGVKR